jgi:hypothetical protein
MFSERPGSNKIKAIILQQAVGDKAQQKFWPYNS